jgi:hypothetical protein
MARIDLHLLPGFETGSTTSGGQDIFREIADVDALCHVVRAFTTARFTIVNGSSIHPGPRERQLGAPP